MRFFIFLAVAATAALAAAARAEERIALVIGNSGYAAVPSLENAGNDARLVAGALEATGFAVTLMEDATQAALKRAVAEFGQALRAGGADTVGLFYYAGHGVQSFGANYLLPVDAKLTDAADLDLVAIDAASVLRQMASARNRTNIVILDACRNNPFEAIRDLNDNGLAEMKAPTGTFLAYATAPGAVALDGTGANSPFSSALAAAMQTEGVPVEQMFKTVRNEVIAATGGLQTPWDTSSLTQDFAFLPARQLSPEEAAEAQVWESVRTTTDPLQVMLFLRSFPEGAKAAEARALLAKLLSEEMGVDAVAPAGQDAPPPPRPAAAAPQDREVALMDAARASGRLEDYRAYLEAFPQGVFAELAKIEIAGIEAKAATDPDPKPSAAAATPAPGAPAAEPEAEPAPVFFDRPMTEGAPEIVGRTIMEVTGLSPLYPPIEGLPEEIWKDKQCSSCHSWTREALCTQAQVYLGESMTRAVAKEHPLGGSFKRNLRAWAANDCR
ncbi:caspase family protein [Mangrovicoccus sp. HB161399]|uniref:caspase family protein n=1 Tax=Mangrovicoccus sp. HB161399 TaxID=2720392 RepID=UPI001557295A|nr:caspase family protein [Mangrovicoccus sp. HB161399]